MNLEFGNPVLGNFVINSSDLINQPIRNVFHFRNWINTTRVYKIKNTNESEWYYFDTKHQFISRHSRAVKNRIHQTVYSHRRKNIEVNLNEYESGFYWDFSLKRCHYRFIPLKCDRDLQNEYEDHVLRRRLVAEKRKTTNRRKREEGLVIDEVEQAKEIQKTMNEKIKKAIDDYKRRVREEDAERAWQRAVENDEDM